MAWTIAQQNSSMQQLINEGGLSPMGAAGLVSRWSNVEDPNGSGATVNGIGAVGIGQWLGARKTALGNFADEFDLDPTDPDTQTQFAIYEGNTTEQSAWSTLQGADTPFDAAVGASMFERAEGYDPSTGIDNFTGKTATGVNSILQNYQNGGNGSDLTSGGGPSDQGLDSSGNLDLNEPNVDAGNPESNEQVDNDVATGNFSAANSTIDTNSDAGIGAVDPSASTPGTDLTAAVNAQTKQLAANTKAETQSDAAIAKGQSTLDTSLVSSIEAYTSNTFVRAALIGVGVIFILAGTLGLSFGGLSGAHKVLAKPLRA